MDELPFGINGSSRDSSTALLAFLKAQVIRNCGTEYIAGIRIKRAVLFRLMFLNAPSIFYYLYGGFRFVFTAEAQHNSYYLIVVLKAYIIKMICLLTGYTKRSCSLVIVANLGLSYLYFDDMHY